MVDIHCHILPETDDGAATWETAAEMCREAAQDSITHIVATPHANDRYAYDRPRLQESLKRLQAVSGDWPTFSLGCDFHFSYENVSAALADPAPFVIGESRYLLIEFSDFAISPFVGDALARLGALGLVPIITHPERNAVLQRSPEMVLRLVESGCLVQVTASALTGFWGETARKAAHWLLKHDSVHFLASDAHDATRRQPVLSAGREAAAKLCGHDVAQALVEHNPRAVITDEPPPFYPRPRLRTDGA